MGNGFILLLKAELFPPKYFFAWKKKEHLFWKNINLFLETLVF